jgi:diacylglycerol kinase (ATP)
MPGRLGIDRSDKSIRPVPSLQGEYSVTLNRDMRAAVILGLGCSAKNLEPFQEDTASLQIGSRNISWRMGLPAGADQADVILLFGGDGTIHRHLSQLVKLALPVLVVPAGSGNDFARALGLRRKQDSLGAWRSFCAGYVAGQSVRQMQVPMNVRNIDLGLVTPLEVACGSSGESSRWPARGTSSYFCSVAGVGLDSEVARRANALPRWLRGHGGYALTLASTIFRFVPRWMKILIPAKTEGWTLLSSKPTTLAAFANTAIYGGGMRIAPHARVDDGQLDLCVIGPIDPFRLACLFPTVYFGRHLRVREVTYLRATILRVETETPLDLYADGEYVCRTPAEVTVAPGALQVIINRLLPRA